MSKLKDEKDMGKIEEEYKYNIDKINERNKEQNENFKK